MADILNGINVPFNGNLPFVQRKADGSDGPVVAAVDNDGLTGNAMSFNNYPAGKLPAPNPTGPELFSKSDGQLYIMFPNGSISQIAIVAAPTQTNP